MLFHVVITEWLLKIAKYSIKIKKYAAYRFEIFKVVVRTFSIVRPHKILAGSIEKTNESFNHIVPGIVLISLQETFMYWKKLGVDASKQLFYPPVGYPEKHDFYEIHNTKYKRR